MSAAFLLTTFVIVATPGTGVLYKLAAGLARGPRASVVAACGYTLGIVPHMVAAITVLAAIMHTSAVAFQALKYLGVAYVLFTAWRIARDNSALTVDETAAKPALGVITSAILINILNPKLTIFFFAFLPQFVGRGEAHPSLRMLEFSGVFMLVTLVVFVAYGAFPGAVRGQIISRPKVMTWMRRCFGGSFVARSRGGSRSLSGSRPGASALGAAEAVEPQEADVVARVAVGRKVGEDLADDGAELEAVAGEAAPDDDLRRVRQPVEDEVLVGAVLEEAGLERHRRPGAVREVALGELAEEPLVVGPRLPLELVRGAVLAEVVVAAELEAGDPEDGEAVVALLLVELQVEDGEPVRREELRAQWLEPGEHLPLRLHGEARELVHPCAGRKDEPVGLVLTAIGRDANAFAAGLPAQHALSRVNFGPVRLRRVDVCDDAPLGQQEPAVGLEHRHRLRVDPVGREPPLDLATVEDLVRKPVVLA